MNQQFGGRAVAALCLVGALSYSSAASAEPVQREFASPEHAAHALLDAMKAKDPAKLAAILGPNSEDLINSGDNVADAEAEAQFTAAYAAQHKIVETSKIKAELLLGKTAFPFAIPIVKSGAQWHFDAAAGRDEILARRIGRNELNAIEVCRTYVQAQNEYAGDDRLAGVSFEYAQHLQSTPGTHDGLYWSGEPQSPFGPLIATARAEGYDQSTADSVDHKPYHGYFYKVLTQQGPAAPGGAHDYLVNGHMIGGFALVAFPARYDDSGVMTFIVNHEGVVYQKNLGPDTAKIASAMTAFNPDEGWEKVQPATQ
jgi:hypothetical protein